MVKFEFSVKCYSSIHRPTKISINYGDWHMYRGSNCSLGIKPFPALSNYNPVYLFSCICVSISVLCIFHISCNSVLYLK